MSFRTGFKTILPRSNMVVTTNNDKTTEEINVENKIVCSLVPSDSLLKISLVKALVSSKPANMVTIAPILWVIDSMP